MTFIDWFAGIGGFRLGLERAGMQCVGSCEIDKSPRRIYAKRFREAPTFRDINEVQPGDIPGADLWCGGFPCQGLSVAGKRGGLDDPRSGLWWQWLSLVEKCRPRWLLIENVPGFLSCSKGADFGLALASMDFLGYGISWRVLDAQYFGVPQRRRRVYIVGHLGNECPPEILFEPEGGEGGFQEKKATAVTLTARGCYSLDDRQTCVYTPADADGMREAAGISRRMDVHVPGTALGGCVCADGPRYRATGNAVAVPVVKWIGKRIMRHRIEMKGAMTYE